MPEPVNKTTDADRRAKVIENLNRNSHQHSAWQELLLNLVQEISNDTLRLRKAYAKHELELRELKEERVNA